jgi:MinD superfamily P-loop ATPase
MNSVDMATALINRAKSLQEFTVEVNVNEPIQLNGRVPFDLSITDGVLTAKVFAVDFDEAVQIVSSFLGD